MEIRRKLIRICLLFWLMLAGVVQGQFTFTTNNGAITITGYTGSGGAVVIPDTINSYPVTRIEDDAFVSAAMSSIVISTNVTSIGICAFAYCGLYNITIGNGITSIGDAAFTGCTSLTMITVETNNPAYSSVNGVLFNKNQTTLIQYPPGNAATSYAIPFTVNTIDYQAFSDCGNLASVTIPTGVNTIMDYAFADCENLTSVTIPNNVTTIGVGAFSVCTHLTAITVDTNNPVYSSVGGVLFDKVQAVLLQYPVGNVAAAYAISDKVNIVGFGAFYGCESLASVTIPSSVSSIETFAFYGCNYLTSVNIAKGVRGIGSSAFFGCALTNITIPNSVTNIGGYAFSYCYSLTGVCFQGNAPSADSTVFKGGNLGVVYYLPGTSGWDSTFANVPTTMLNPPNPAGSLQVTIGPAAAVARASWQVDGGIPQPGSAIVLGLSVGSHTVSFNTLNDWISPTNYIVSVSAGSTATATGLYTQVEFSYTKNADNSVTIVGYHGPGGVVAIPGMINGLRVTSIGEYAFQSCYSLTNVTIPNGVTNIQDYAFAQCFNLVGITIPDSVNSIGYYAFGDCYKMPSITIPGSVTYLGGAAFSDCTGLTNIYFQGNAPNVEFGVFSYDYRTTAYYLPGTTGWVEFASNTYLPTILWNPQAQTGGLNFGVRTNRFGFNIAGSSNLVIVVEACTDLANPTWTPIGTNTLNAFVGTNGTSYFSDSQWTNYPGRFYRFRSP